MNENIFECENIYEWDNRVLNQRSCNTYIYLYIYIYTVLKRMASPPTTACRVLYLRGYGGYEKMEIDEMEIPSPKPGEVN